MTKPFTLASDPRQSTPHMLFLMTFLQMRPPDQYPIISQAEWNALLEESPQEAVNRLVARGNLVWAGLEERLDHACNTAQLEEMAGSLNVPLGGRKIDLIGRLIQADRAAMLQAVPDLRLVQCAPATRQHLLDWMAQPGTVDSLSDERFRAGTISILLWLLKDAITLEQIGSAVWQLLAQIDEAAARNLRKRRQRRDQAGVTYVTPILRLEWCHLPAGSFLMGSADGDADAGDEEKPQHPVYLPAFYIAKYPITNHQYQVFIQASGHRRPAHWQDGRIRPGEEYHPVRYVSWQDALAFSQWAARTAALPIRLLTEAEWEKAARGPKAHRYPWGNRWKSGRSNSNKAIGHTTPVGQLPAGPYGVCDLIGNVWEWTASLYRPYPYQADDGREELEAGGVRVFRGGSWLSQPEQSRAAFRSPSHFNLDFDVGFRVGWSTHFLLPSERG